MVPAEYRSKVVVDWERENRPCTVRASVVVVTYGTSRRALAETFSGLLGQTCGAFEVVVVDNGTDWDVLSAIRPFRRLQRYLRLDDNYGPCLARNLGAHVALGDVVIFLDDDAVPAHDFVTEHLAAHEREGLVAVRGRVVSRTENTYALLSTFYDMGNRPFPWYVNIEGNSSFDRRTFLDFDGFDERLGGRAGHEGIELSSRLIEGGIDRKRVCYWPGAVVFHDYADGFHDYLSKQVGRKRTTEYLQRSNPTLFEFSRSYRPPVDFRPTYSAVDRLKILFVAGVAKVLTAVAG